MKNHTEIAGTPTFYVATFVFRDEYGEVQGAAAELKKIIDDHAGLAGAKFAGNAWDQSGIPVREMVAKRGNAIHVLSDEETARWRAACKPVVDGWLSPT